jgi:uncharacterized protein YjbI with pentapeptide repeats
MSANLTGARLEHANLTGAKLGGAKLDGAKLTGAKLDGAKLPRGFTRGEQSDTGAAEPTPAPPDT